VPTERRSRIARVARSLGVRSGRELGPRSFTEVGRRWRATGRFELAFAAPAEDVWHAWLTLTCTSRVSDSYECEVRHAGTAEKLGLIRACRYPMIGGLVARSWEWVTAIDHDAMTCTFEGVASPPLAFAGGTTTVRGRGNGHSILVHDERFVFVARPLQRLSRLVFRRLSAADHQLAERQMQSILCADVAAGITPIGERP
jgi:hypothetical protein